MRDAKDMANLMACRFHASIQQQLSILFFDEPLHTLRLCVLIRGTIGRSGPQSL